MTWVEPVQMFAWSGVVRELPAIDALPSAGSLCRCRYSMSIPSELEVDLSPGWMRAVRSGWDLVVPVLIQGLPLIVVEAPGLL